MKKILISFREKILIFFLLAVIAASVLSPLSSNTSLPNILDLYNHLAAIIQAHLGLSEGQFPLRVAPVEQSGWRYPFYQFYSPASYTLAAFIYHWLTPSNPFIAYKLTIGLLMIVGGGYIFKLVNWFLKSKPTALLASIMYLTTPYYIIVVDHMASFNEALALGMVPVVLYYTLQRYTYPNENKILLKAACAWCLLLTIHIITFVYTSCFIGALLIFITLQNRHYVPHLLRTGIAYIFGLMLAMWYLAPIYFLKNNLTIHNEYGDFKKYNFYRPSLSDLLSPTPSFSNGIFKTKGIIDSISQVHPALGFPLLFGVCIALCMLFNSSSAENKQHTIWLKSLLITFFLGVILVWSPIDFSRWVSRDMIVGQYSWRMLGQLIWIGALLFAFAIYWFFKNNLDNRHVVLGIFVLLSATSMWLPITEKSFATIDFNALKKKPVLANHRDSYLLDFKKSHAWIKGIDTISISSLLNDEQLFLNYTYHLPFVLLKNTVHPQITLSGTLPNHHSLKQITAYVNGKAISTIDSSKKNLNWTIPLTFKPNQPVAFELKTKLPITQPLSIKVDKIVLGGFQDSAEILSVTQTTKYCHRDNATTICELPVNSHVKFIELPILYYPDLLHITLNGQTISYSSLLYDSVLLTAIKPLPGIANTITIEFSGLHWANTLSKIAWGIFLIFLMFCLCNSMQDSRVTILTIFFKRLLSKSLPTSLFQKEK